MRKKDVSVDLLLGGFDIQRILKHLTIPKYVKVKNFNKNMFHSGGINLLSKESGAEYIYILSPDAVLFPNTLSTILDFKDNVNNFGGLESRQVPIDHPKVFNSIGEVSWNSGACTLYTREIFLKVRGYDSSNFPMEFNDVDLSWRLRDEGFTNYLVSNSIVYHSRALDNKGQFEHTKESKIDSLVSYLKFLSKYAPEDYKLTEKEKVYLELRSLGIRYPDSIIKYRIKYDSRMSKKYFNEFLLRNW